MNLTVKIISVFLSFSMLNTLGSVFAASPNNTDNRGITAQTKAESKSVDKRLVLGGIGTAAGIPVCALLGYLICHSADSPNILPEKISEFENVFLKCFAQRVGEQKNNEACVSYEELMRTCSEVKPLLEQDGHMPRVNGPTILVGDIHADFKAAKFYCEQFLERLKSNHKTNIVFLGDYVDRGSNNAEIIYMLFKLKMAFPKNVYLISGNHESNLMPGTFFSEIYRKYKSDAHAFFSSLYNGAFRSLPLAAVVNKEVFCVHAGISANLSNQSELIDLNTIDKLPRRTEIPFVNDVVNDFSGYDRDDPDGFIVHNMLWADFYDVDRNTFFEDYGRKALSFGRGSVIKFLDKNNLKILVRGHSHPRSGKSVSRDNKVVTLLSAPNYCGSYGNNGYALYLTGDDDVGGNPITEDIICSADYNRIV